MTRVRTLFLTVLPSMIAGGFLFASAFGHAETGRDGVLGSWPAASDAATHRVLVAQADPWATPRSRPARPPNPPAPPAPPAPYVGPMPPMPPVPTVRPHGRHGRGVSVTFRDGKLEVDGIADLIQGQLEGVSDLLDNLPDVPPDVRARVKERVKAVRSKVKARLGQLKSMDVDKIGPEMERMGDEIEKEMESLDKDLEKLGSGFGKHFAQKLGKDLAKSIDLGHLNQGDSDDEDDEDDEDAIAMPPGTDSDLDPAGLPPIADLKNLTLEPGQKAALAKLRADADRQVSAAKRSLDEMSSRLHDALGDGGASEADIARQIDSISAQEAIIRKARILSWVKARNVLHADQRKQVEAAVKRDR